MVYDFGKNSKKRIPHNQLIYLINVTNGTMPKGDSAHNTSSNDRASAMVTMYSDGPTKARQRLSLLTVKASGARSVPRATTLPSQSGTNNIDVERGCMIC